MRAQHRPAYIDASHTLRAAIDRVNATANELEARRYLAPSRSAVLTGLTPADAPRGAGWCGSAVRTVRFPTLMVVSLGVALSTVVPFLDPAGGRPVLAEQVDAEAVCPLPTAAD